MKKLYSKIPAMIAMLITIISAGVTIAALVMSIGEPDPGCGVSRSFALGILGLLVALFSLPFYFIDAVLSVIKVFKKIHPVFNGVLTLVIIGAIPAIFAKSGLPDIRIAVYPVIIFVFEAISIIKHIQMARADSKKDTVE